MLLYSYIILLKKLCFQPNRNKILIAPPIFKLDKYLVRNNSFSLADLNNLR
ncbi:hypothetical protein GvMRE_Ic2g52 [endosymbiont GvMRE of Glomus versiforme]|nr:hypothetical protein GvMRE_Ic2g52 [endosymbiont GvMRE of Glomus versiforme]